MRKPGRNAIAVSDQADVPIIGYVGTYTLPDREVSGAKMVRAWANHGLDPADLPEARQPVHIFETAVRKQETRKVNGTVEQVKVDRVKVNAAECVYQVTRQVTDLANAVVEHEKSMRVRFDKKASILTFEGLDPDAYQALRPIEKAIRKDFEANAKTVPGQKLRNAIRKKIVHVGGQNLRRKAGGLYFIPTEYPNETGMKPTAPILGTMPEGGTPPPAPNGITGVLHELYGDDADFYTLRVAGDEGEREMVRKHFMINASEKARELMEKAYQRLRQDSGRGARSDLLANMWNERRRLHGMVDQFEQLVEFERTEIEKDLTDLDSALNLLQEQADTP